MAEVGEDRSNLDRWTAALSQACRERIETMDSFLELREEQL